MGNLKRNRDRPEAIIQKALIEFLKDREWMVEHTHGSLFQTGFPDLFVAHRENGTRWIDCKVEGRYSFTRDQKRKWPVWESYGIGIWILTGADDENYAKLFKPPNWRKYWKKSWGALTPVDIEKLLDGLRSGIPADPFDA